MSGIQLTGSQKKAEPPLAPMLPLSWSGSCGTTGAFCHFPMCFPRLITCEVPLRHHGCVMDTLPAGNCSFWCSAWRLCFTSGSLSRYLFYDLSADSDHQSLRVLFAAHFSCLACSVSVPASAFWVTVNEHALAECLLLQEVTPFNISKTVQCLWSVLPLSECRTCSHLALPTGHLQQ